jgi:2-keto-4-pentenoate hydratase
MPSQQILDIAQAFVAARQASRSLSDYPGVLPTDLRTAYQVQEAAMNLWPDEVVGWKVGLLAPSERLAMGTTRLAGPIFSSGLMQSAGRAPVHLAAIVGGFAAIEVELVVAARADAPQGQTEWTLEQAAAIAGEWRVGVEFAASPLSSINDLGATAVVSDFGNNSGLVLGPPIESKLIGDAERLVCETKIEGVRVGFSSAAVLPGGALEALRFLLGHLAERGRSLRAGQWVSTGAITGVHQILPGQHGSAEFIGRGRVEVIVDEARASPRRS